MILQSEDRNTQLKSISCMPFIDLPFLGIMVSDKLKGFIAILATSIRTEFL